MSEVWEHAPLVGTDLLVLMALADMANDDRRECWPGLKNLAHKARISIRQVSNILSDLELQGIIVISARMTEAGGTTSNLYRVNETSSWAVLTEYESENTPLNHSSTPPRTVEHPPHEAQNIPPISVAPVEVHTNRLVKPSNEAKSGKKKSKPTATEIFREEWQRYEVIGDALLLAFGLGFVPAANQTMSALESYLDVAIELTDACATVEQIPALYKYIKERSKKENWSTFSVKTLARYYTDFLKTYRAKIVYDDPAMDLNIPQPIVPILVREAANHHG